MSTIDLTNAPPGRVDLTAGPIQISFNTTTGPLIATTTPTVLGTAADQGEGPGGATLSGLGRDAVLSTLPPNHPYRSVLQNNPDFFTYNAAGANPGAFQPPVSDQLARQINFGPAGLAFRDPSSGQAYAFLQPDQSQRYMAAYGISDSTRYTAYIAANEVTQKIFAQDLANGRINAREWELLSNAASAQVDPKAAMLQDVLASYDPNPNPNYAAGIDVTRNAVSQVLTQVGLGTGNPQADFQSFVDGFRQTGRDMVGNGQINMDARGPVEVHRALTAYVDQIAGQARDPATGLPLTGEQLMGMLTERVQENYNAAAQGITSRLTVPSGTTSSTPSSNIVALTTPTSTPVPTRF